MTTKERTIPKKEYLFGKNHSEWILPSGEYLSYVTPNEIADIVFKEASSCLGLRNRAIWDMFAGIGTDTIRLAQCAGKVYATEINPDTFQCLLSNIDIQGSNNICASNKCCTDISGIPLDVIYFDPPWGPNFVSGKMFDLSKVEIGNTTVGELLDKLKVHDMIIKVPFLCETVEEHIDSDSIIQVLTFSRHKLKFYITSGQK